MLFLMGVFVSGLYVEIQSVLRSSGHCGSIFIKVELNLCNLSSSAVLQVYFHLEKVFYFK